MGAVGPISHASATWLRLRPDVAGGGEEGVVEAKRQERRSALVQERSATDNVGPTTVLRAANHLSAPTLTIRAAGFVTAPQQDVLTRAGFPADTVAQLGAAAAALDSAIIERANAKVRRVGSTEGIHEELLKGREAVAMLNAVVSKQFVGDKTFLAAWRAAHRVTAKPGTARVPVAVSLSTSAAASHHRRLQSSSMLRRRRCRARHELNAREAV
jgi:hypothetical protein